MRRHDETWPGLPIVLLCVSLLTTAVLALQAHSAFTYHRVTAEQVLRDFAGIAGSEFVRRSTSHLAYDGYMTLRGSLARGKGEGGDPRVRHAAELARRTFTASPRAEALRFSPDAPPDDVRVFLLAKLVTGVPPGRPFVAVSGVSGGASRRFVFGPSADGAEVVGFEVESTRVAPWLAEVMEKGPLLPPTIGHGRVTNDALFLSVADEGGAEIFRWGKGAWPGLAVTVPFGQAYSGVLDGAVLQVCIDPAAARHLVMGGLPRSRLPLVLGLLGVSTGLLVTALLQLRREQALQRLRVEFVASVSHELRTPLTQIRMFAETLLLKRIRSEEEGERALEILDREARRLTHLVENVLQFSRGERGAVSLELSSRRLAPLVRDVLEQFAPIAGPGVRFVASLPEEAEARIDPDALRQILLNLLDNAVKYGPTEQEIVVAVERAERGVRLVVEDRGPGVPPRERLRIFERFQRLERDRLSSVAGTGIGLAVVSDLAARMHGKAFVEDAPSGGARFVVELPV